MNRAGEGVSALGRPWRNAARSLGCRAVVLSFFFAPLAADAHDTWVVAERDRLAPGETVRLVLATGETFPKSENAAKPDRVEEWVAVGPEGRVQVGGLVGEGDDLAARPSFEKPGAYVIAVALKPKFILLEAKDFQDYLGEEHAEGALETRQTEHQSDQPGRELYTKLAKTFVQVGDAGKGEQLTKPVGHALEIVPLSNPLEWRAGDVVPVRVLLSGKPAEGISVSSLREGLPPHRYVQVTTTDSDGVVQIRLPRPGLWMIRTHAIRPTPGKIFEDSNKSAAVDWESYFASITLLVPPKGAPASP